MSTMALHEPAGAAAQAPGTSARIRVRGLSKRYGALEVFRGIDFDLGEREIITIVGPSGCGKTTLLRCIDGLIPVDAGEIWCGRERVTEPIAGMAMVFQHFGLFPWKTVRENVAYGLRMAGASAGEIAERVPQFIKLGGLARARAQGAIRRAPPDVGGPKFTVKLRKQVRPWPPRVGCGFNAGCWRPFPLYQLQASPTQKVPDIITNVRDTFYAVEGTIRIFLQQPKEEVYLARGQTFPSPEAPAHFTNANDTSAVFLCCKIRRDHAFVAIRGSIGFDDGAPFIFECDLTPSLI